MSDFITNTKPVTLSERAYANAERDHRSWYIVQRGEEIGLTAEPDERDDVIEICEPD